VFAVSRLPRSPDGTRPRTTLRAAARRRGGGRRVVPGCCGPRRRACVVVDVAVSTRDPTCEQLLAAGGRVLGCLGVVGGGRGGGRPVVVTWPLAPTIHPASRHSQRWGWVPLLVVVNGLWGWWAVSGDVARLGGLRCVPCGFPAARASRHLPGHLPAPNEPLTSCFNREEGLGARRESSL
jgi:hypothetical protein